MPLQAARLTRPATPAPLLALALILLVLAPLWHWSKPDLLGSYDQKYYLGIAGDLIQTGRFTDGATYAGPGPADSRPSGMRFVPLYPLLVAAAMRLEPAFRQDAACVMAHYADSSVCPNAARLVRGAQFLMLAVVYWLIWWLGRAVTCSPCAGWSALGLALLTAPYLLRSVNYVMTETTALLLSTAATAAFVAGLRPPHRRYWFAATGLLLGLLTLTRPEFLYLAIAAALAALTVARHPPAFAALALFVAGFALPVAPWILRNAAVLGRPALSYGYDSHTLVQRISYDAMDWREYGLAYICGLPDGTALGARIAGPGACDRFGLDQRPGTFYQIGIGPLLEQTLAASGGYDHHLSYLLTHYIARTPLWHALVSIPMALRGAWVDHYWGLALFAVCCWTTISAARRGDRRFLALAGPAWLMLAFHAAVAVNQVRYNLMLVPPYAVAGAMLIERIARRRIGQV